MYVPQLHVGKFVNVNNLANYLNTSALIFFFIIYYSRLSNELSDCQAQLLTLKRRLKDSESEIDRLKQQLRQYVQEIKKAEDLLMQKVLHVTK